MYLRRERPKLSSLNYTIWAQPNAARPFVQVWFRTRGCRHNHCGSCTMCDYSVSDPVPPEQMVAYVEAAIAELDFEPAVLLLNASGSVWDDWEVPAEARLGVYEVLSQFPQTTFVFETHADTVSKAKIDECTAVLGKERVKIEMGLETADPWVLGYCVNKALNLQDFKRAVRILKQQGIDCAANILIGIPFLTPTETMEGAIRSVKWAFREGVDWCVLFPVHVKPWTLVHWLAERGMYTPVSLWTLVEIISRLELDWLPRIDIAWHKSRQPTPVEYKIASLSPTTCPECYNPVVELIDEYTCGDQRAQVVQKLVNRSCACYTLWRAQLETQSPSPLHERIRVYYQMIGEGVLGRGWWIEHGSSVLDDIMQYPQNMSGDI